MTDERATPSICIYDRAASPAAYEIRDYLSRNVVPFIDRRIVWRTIS